ncbi:dTDP-4-dehydrorhamnose reductase [Thiomicrospira aerophila AL3]|uniref:dTDP-4-dehydrorhamnose reductase n=1 Tax=Thiomicrospira aerophila AL3 TaxID=717772 RepID=W0DR10_9GAMM|nr:dTDP-4-dehydrorhamnose reductase [Thiomicrospira aerophila]AHF01065.1 dTDP-4-dehydrorhamnose reductase [Thiomicrospira aerophila AL3]
MTNRILVVGKTSQLGQSLQKLVGQAYHKQALRLCERSEAISLAGYDFSFVGRDTLDLANPSAIDAFFTHHRFDVVINCAAYTNVDQAELEPELANQINYLAVKQLAKWAKLHKSFLIHISSDYVFDGTATRPYLESDLPNPINCYGQSKLKSEQACLFINPRGVIIRTSWLFSEFGHNFVKTMLRLGVMRETLAVVSDQLGSPTYATDLAQAVLSVIAHTAKSASSNMEIYHFTNAGVCSWYDFAQAIFELKAIDCQLKPITSEDYAAIAKRPAYTELNNAKIMRLPGLLRRPWQEALTECLTEINHVNPSTTTQ